MEGNTDLLHPCTHLKQRGKGTLTAQHNVFIPCEHVAIQRKYKVVSESLPKEMT
jgi:hypothetical protein